MTHDLGEHFFRHEFGRLVAMLARRVGMRHLALVEDAVQHALLVSVESWPRSGVPDSPSAWLFRVAHNHLVGELRQRCAAHALGGANAALELPGRRRRGADRHARRGRSRRPAPDALRLLRRVHPARVAARDRTQDPVRVRRSRDRRTAVHDGSEHLQAPGPRPESAPGVAVRARRSRPRSSSEPDCPRCSRSSTSCSPRATSRPTPTRRSDGICATRRSVSPTSSPSIRSWPHRRPVRWWR